MRVQSDSFSTPVALEELLPHVRGNKRCHPIFLIVDVGTESRRVSANMQLEVSENTSRSEFSDHLLIVLHTKCHKEWFKNTLC